MKDVAPEERKPMVQDWYSNILGKGLANLCRTPFQYYIAEWDAINLLWQEDCAPPPGKLLQHAERRLDPLKPEQILEFQRNGKITFTAKGQVYTVNPVRVLDESLRGACHLNQRTWGTGGSEHHRCPQSIEAAEKTTKDTKGKAEKDAEKAKRGAARAKKEADDEAVKLAELSQRVQRVKKEVDEEAKKLAQLSQKVQRAMKKAEKRAKKAAEAMKKVENAAKDPTPAVIGGKLTTSSVTSSHDRKRAKRICSRDIRDG